MVRYQRKKTILKWTCLIAAMLLIAILQTTVFNRLRIFGVFPFLFPCMVASVAVLSGPSDGAAFGLCSGFFFDLISQNTYGFCTLWFTLCGVSIGLLSKSFIRKSLGGGVFCSAVSLLLLDIVMVLYHTMFQDASLWAAIKLALIEVVYSTLFAPFVYLLFFVIIRRFGTRGD